MDTVLIKFQPTDDIVTKCKKSRKIFFFLGMTLIIVILWIVLQNDMFSAILPADECHVLCRTRYNSKVGYPPVTNEGKYSNLVSMSMFRDLSDYVIRWPYGHWGENIKEQNPQKVVRCLPPIPIIFIKGDPENIDYFYNDILPYLKTPYIIISGATDYSAFQQKNQTTMLDDERLIRWYGQNPIFEHPKFEPIPIGINAYEHGDGISKFRKLNENELFHRSNYCRKMSDLYGNEFAFGKPLVLNFSPSKNNRRAKLYDKFCNDKNFTKWTQCLQKVDLFYQNNEHLPYLRMNTEYYKSLSCFPFWLSPEGNGLDCHRTWEAFYTNSIPILESSHLNAIYKDMRVLIVQNYTQLTEDFLLEKYKEYTTRTFNTEKLKQNFWWLKIESVRTAHLRTLNLQDSDRRRCWA